MHPDCKATCEYILQSPETDTAAYGKHMRSFGEGACRLYADSVHAANGCVLFLAKALGEKYLWVVEKEAAADSSAFEGKVMSVGGRTVRKAPLSHANAVVIRRWFPFARPVAFGRQGVSIGLGDRLGLAGPGHLRIIRKTKARPVLAQQSIRELNLTGRRYEDVLDSATWAVLQEGYHLGYGADGDHLKTADEVRQALALEFSMITLDCSEQIDNRVAAMSKGQIAAAYREVPQPVRDELERLYLDQGFTVGGQELFFDPTTLREIVLTYRQALDFIGEIYGSVVQSCPRPVDFEVSIDETMTPTTPEAHYFVAAELERRGVVAASLAPRFCGEFQKAIDYIGDIDQFRREFVLHAAIADHFGYRLSIHSGSDKFSVYPVIGEITGERVHVKTAGTNWLEALKVIAAKKPSLFREIYMFAREHFAEAAAYYHVTTDLAKAPDPEQLADVDLKKVLLQADGRQVLHITYGLILTAKQADGSWRFRDTIYKTLEVEEDAYADTLFLHIQKHLLKLGMEVFRA
ncbi:MAG: tagaturonate epimerase family protein [Sporomusaceae bacterium]|nr:tagaturonate epimerase family protein [Sporomusaceae bacterium]